MGYRTQSSSVALPDKVVPRESTFGTCGGTNRLYVLYNGQEHGKLSDVVICMSQVFDFTVYAYLDLRANLSFVTPYNAINFDVILCNLVNH